jgi:cell division inhibitor SepF
MPTASPLKSLLSWFTDDGDDDLEMDEMNSPANTPSPAPQHKRNRGPLMLNQHSEGGMEIRHPRTLDERMSIGMDLKQKRMVTLDLTRLPENDARYFLEFVYGVVFALDATAEKVTEGIYLLAPRGIAVRNDQEELPVEAAPAKAAAPRTTRTASNESGQEELFWQVR